MAPESENIRAINQRPATLSGTITKWAGAIAAVTGAAIGVIQFFKLGWLVILPTSSAAILGGLGFFAYRVKNRGVSIALWIIFGILLLPLVIASIAYVWISIISDS